MRQYLSVWLVLFCGASVVIAAEEPAKKAERPKAPSGFQWQELEGMGGSVLLPMGWFFSKNSTKDSVVCRVTQEDATQGSFLTGLTVNVIRDVKAKAKADPFMYSAFYVDSYRKGAKTFGDPKVDTADGFDRLVCDVEKEIPGAAKGVVFHVRLMTLANKETDTLYVITFGSPKDQWEKAWKIGEPVLASLTLPPAPPAAEVNAIRLLVPIPELETRLGKDPKVISEFILDVKKATLDCLATAKLPLAKGLLLTVGMKPSGTTKVWCEAVEGEVPAELLRKLEREVAAVKPCPVKANMAFALQLELAGRKVEKFPEFPAVWLEGAKKKEGTLLIPPDELFKTIWPD
ncbi:MAG: hypothetical protein ACR2FY_19845 [Pirellulaceae bacterium]